MIFIDEAIQLFGKSYEVPEVVEFLSSQPEHRADKPSDGDQYIICKNGGFDLLFSYGGDARHSIKNRLLVAIFLYPEGVERHKQYSGELPYGFLMTDDREALHKKKLPDLTWLIGEGKVDISEPLPDSEKWFLEHYELHVVYKNSLHIAHIILSPRKNEAA